MSAPYPPNGVATTAESLAPRALSASWFVGSLCGRGGSQGRMVSGNGTSLNAGQTRTLPSHLRYAKLSADLPEPEKRTPSQLCAELKGTVQLPVALKRPQVIELLNMSEYTHNVESVVPLDEPLFQPTPPEVVFEAFEPLQKYTALLSLRNNDNVNRRIKIVKPDSSVFSIEPPKVLSSGSGGGKVAPGMEVLFKVHFAATLTRT